MRQAIDLFLFLIISFSLIKGVGLFMDFIVVPLITYAYHLKYIGIAALGIIALIVAIKKWKTINLKQLSLKRVKNIAVSKVKV